MTIEIQKMYIHENTIIGGRVIDSSDSELSDSQNISTAKALVWCSF
jgi:hypothetical protein